MKTLKYSRQKGSIKVCLVNHHDHPTAGALYVSIREGFPDISLGTVYHNPNLLAEADETRKLTCGDGAVHSDGDVRQHYHFMCSECDQVYDMELGAMEDLSKEIQEHVPDIIDSYYVLFYGRCSSCLQEKIDKAIDRPA